MLYLSIMNLHGAEVYTSEEAQKLLKISDSTFRRLVKKGILRAAKIGGQYRVLGAHILELLNPSLPGQVKKIYKKVVRSL